MHANEIAREHLPTNQVQIEKRTMTKTKKNANSMIDLKASERKELDRFSNVIGEEK